VSIDGKTVPLRLTTGEAVHRRMECVTNDAAVPGLVEARGFAWPNKLLEEPSGISTGFSKLRLQPRLRRPPPLGAASITNCSKLST
jgi:hypothetical protein